MIANCRRPFTVALLLSLPFAGCTKPAASEHTATVFAAASLTAAFEDLAKAFEASSSGHQVELHFAGTPQLVVQLQEGAPVDVFASADEPNMQKVVATGKTAAEPRIFARNRLTIVTAPGNPKRIKGLADLGRAGLRAVLCGPEVPAGHYARDALGLAGVTVTSVSDEPNVKAVVSKVQLGEVDAGIVYVTDAKAAGAAVGAVAIPDEHNVVAEYPVAAMTAGHGRAAGEAFVTFLFSAKGQRILESYGFQRP